MKTVKLITRDQRVLKALMELGGESNEGTCFYFRTIAKHAHMKKRDVRLGCRSLARKGLAIYERGLFSDYGEGGLAGSGYRATEAAEAIFQTEEDDIPGEPML